MPAWKAIVRFVAEDEETALEFVDEIVDDFLLPGTDTDVTYVSTVLEEDE